jgi:hypothetical protein
MCVEYIHALLSVGYHVPDMLLFNHACIPLRKKGIRISEFALLLRVVTLWVANFPLSICSQGLANHLDREVL